MTPAEMMLDLAGDNGRLRGVTGSGRPGLHTLLGGTGSQEGADRITLSGGSGPMSSAAKLARAHQDLRLAAVASGTSSRVYDGSNDGERKPGDKTR